MHRCWPLDRGVKFSLYLHCWNTKRLVGLWRPLRSLEFRANSSSEYAIQLGWSHRIGGQPRPRHIWLHCSSSSTRALFRHRSRGSTPGCVSLPSAANPRPTKIAQPARIAISRLADFCPPAASAPPDIMNALCRRYQPAINRGRRHRHAASRILQVGCCVSEIKL